MAIEPIPPDDYTWPTCEVKLATLHASLDELAERSGLEITSFEEDVMAPVRGVGFRTSSGLVFLISQWHLCEDELAVCVDASALGKCGAEMLVAELIAELGVSRTDFVQVADAAAQAEAAYWAEQMEECRRRASLPQEYGGEISFDLVMEDEMDFIEGTYRLRHTEWQVFIFSRYDGIHVESSCGNGVVFHIPRNMKLNREVAKQLLGERLYVDNWLEIRGPDSMRLR
jgi:hypothetical protein